MFYLIIALSAFFFLALPALGAFNVRRRWRCFRRDLIAAAAYPFAQLDSPPDGSPRRYFGSIDSIEEGEILWLRSARLSARVCLRGERVFFLSQVDDPPAMRLWERVGSISEGTKVFVAGPMHEAVGLPFFKKDRNHPLVVLFYRGEDESVLRRAVAFGRQRNEYWNALTPGSLAGGFLTLLLTGYFLAGDVQTRSLSVLSFICAALPLLPFIPPGAFFTSLYRRLWRRARMLRVERDVMLLPPGVCAVKETPTAALGSVGRRAVLLECVAVLLLCAAMLVNLLIALYFLLWMRRGAGP